MKYLIHEANMERLEKKLTTIKNKCLKYNNAFHYETVDEQFKEFLNEKGETEFQTYLVVDVDGTALLNDWELIAKIDHEEAGNIIKSGNNSEVPRIYFSAPCKCDHCKSNRYRKTTYVIRNTKTGEYKQVGRNCLCDYTHGLSAEAVAEYISSFDELIKGEYFEGTGYTHWYDTEELLLMAKECVDKFGYVKRNFREQEDYDYERDKDKHSTYDMIFEVKAVLENSLFKSERIEREMERVHFNYDTEENKKYVHEAIEWAKQKDEENSYFHNINVLAHCQCVKAKDISLVISIIPAYYKNLANIEKQKREAELAEKNSKETFYFNGKIKERLRNIKVTYEYSTAFDKIAYSYYDDTVAYYHTFKDSDGHVFAWKTAEYIQDDFKKGDELFITGTIKEFSEYKGTHQTVLTRCKLSKIA